MCLQCILINRVQSLWTKSRRQFNKVKQDIKKLLGHNTSSVQLLMKDPQTPGHFADMSRTESDLLLIIRNCCLHLITNYFHYL